MRTYDTYKDSGISWLGQIPSHWDVKRARIVLAENASVNSDVSVTKQLQFKYGEIEPKANQSVDDVVKETISKYTVVDKGDIMINGLNLNYDFISQRVAQVQEKGCITSAYVSLRPTKLANSRYYTYYLKAMDNIKMFHGMGSGVRLTLSYKELKNMYIPIPPIEEQREMANYIDSATAEIDKAIASQQRMVELLQERKQIIINQAVTQGLNPGAPMKPTNIDWLPQIPAHWQLKKIKYVVLLKSGQNLTSEQIEKEDLYPVYGGNGLRGYYSDYNNDGDYVLIGRQGALCGNINYAHNKFWATEHAVVCYPVDRVNVLWLGETLRAMNLNRYATASAQPGLAVENIKGLMMPVPDYKEQNDIAVFIEKQTKPIDESIESCNRMIGALTERKQILINDIVTGKIKII